MTLPIYRIFSFIVFFPFLRALLPLPSVEAGALDPVSKGGTWPRNRVGLFSPLLSSATELCLPSAGPAARADLTFFRVSLDAGALPSYKLIPASRLPPFPCFLFFSFWFLLPFFCFLFSFCFASHRVSGAGAGASQELDFSRTEPLLPCFLSILFFLLLFFWIRPRGIPRQLHLMEQSYLVVWGKLPRPHRAALSSLAFLRATLLL